MDRANYALASYLARIGRHVHLVGHRVAKDLTSLPCLTYQPVPKPLGSDFLGKWWLNAIGKAAARQQPARVLVNGGNCVVSDANWVHYVHAAYHPSVTGSVARRLKRAIEHRVYRRAERQALRQARVIIANSHRTRQDLIECLGIEEGKIHVVYYGIDPSLFQPVHPEERLTLRARYGWTDDRPVVLFIGALGDRRKGFDTVFQAWSQITSSCRWDGRLCVVGEGAERPLWEKRVVEAGLSDSIHFLGFRTDVPDLLRAADLLVAPTRYESYGLGVHEALCCGLPAIVSAAAGVAERYPQQLKDLLLPDPDDAAHLAHIIIGWREDYSTWQTRIKPLAESLRTWTWDDMAQAIWERIA